MNVIQVQINENIRMLDKHKDRRDREKEEGDRIKSLPTHTTISTIQVIEDLQTFSTHHIPDTSQTYLLFQTLLLFLWPHSCMIWTKLTWTDAVFSRSTSAIFYCAGF